ncbi:uncharacterized protein LOC125133391 [Phacochoerus africanus]|uniref:uncharacterized protein LOC125133391 n=1 Tax=Phacochoerus africanus TaxID=41426 RepID=UPI001FDA8C88|nr:uncharacterized protein LOC125133391 [Phacochoerus africanus]
MTFSYTTCVDSKFHLIKTWAGVDTGDSTRAKARPALRLKRPKEEEEAPTAEKGREASAQRSQAREPARCRCPCKARTDWLFEPGPGLVGACPPSPRAVLRRLGARSAASARIFRLSRIFKGPKWPLPSQFPALGALLQELAHANSQQPLKRRLRCNKRKWFSKDTSVMRVWKQVEEDSPGQRDDDKAKEGLGVSLLEVHDQGLRG